jgi:hypothetical protein
MNSYISSQNINVGFLEITSKTIKGGTANAFDRLFSTYDYDGVPFNEYEELCMDWQDLNVHFSDMKYLIYNKLQTENVVPAGYKPIELTEFIGYQEQAVEGIHYYQQYTFKLGFPINRGENGSEEL